MLNCAPIQPEETAMPCPLCGAKLHPTATTCPACGGTARLRQTPISLAIAIGGVLLLASGLALTFAAFSLSALAQVAVGVMMILGSTRLRQIRWGTKR
jgi:hypothetical protein